MTSPFISPATTDDIPALNQLVNSAYRGDSSRKGWTTEADLLGGIRTTEETLAEQFANPNATILRYVKDEQLLGCVYLEQKGDDLYLGMLTVTPALQAGGLGRQLLEAAEEYARDRQCRAVTMTVISQRHELIAWYERRGFKPTGAVHPFPDDPDRFGQPKTQLSFIELEKAIRP
ncbi:GNAT family N-acetyltransferase [Fibrella forsythiae]|uniref:GNAT family N-acetyltransferase n=1 Tax=Fibrella forsythiae TaxID=2817061 RepID=A0ABS3JKM1_9BACT|nr:GNAT family N-acetyltransferase [Fibrella forsythiae]MBO0950540.1 GNAT family N-acetyltransferase [Fibrella forsythiae]